MNYVQGLQGMKAACSIDELRLFAERAAQAELKVLLKYSLSKAGYDCNN